MVLDGFERNEDSYKSLETKKAIPKEAQNPSSQNEESLLKRLMSHICYKLFYTDCVYLFVSLLEMKNKSTIENKEDCRWIPKSPS